MCAGDPVTAWDRNVFTGTSYRSTLTAFWGLRSAIEGLGLELKLVSGLEFCEDISSEFTRLFCSNLLITDLHGNCWGSKQELT